MSCFHQTPKLPQRKKPHANTTTSVASILVRLCISDGCVAGMSQQHHLVLHCWGDVNATLCVALTHVVTQKKKRKIQHSKA